MKQTRKTHQSEGGCLQPVVMPSPRDWTADSSYENGNYWCLCLQCNLTFIGHKRRHVCKVCDDQNQMKWEAMTPAEQEEFQRHREAEVAAWVAQRHNIRS